MYIPILRWAESLVAPCILVWMTWSAATHAMPLPDRELVAITAVTVIDVEHGRSIGPRTVLVDDGRIIAIVAPSEAVVPADAQRVDGRGRFLVPGLVDMHVHLFNLQRPPNDWAFPLFVVNGVTGVREMNAKPADMAMVHRWRKGLDDGDLIVPRILAAGVPIRASLPVAAANQVEAAAGTGADFIKIFSEISVSQWRATLGASRAHSLPVAGHVPAGVSLLVAAAAGQSSNEHLMQVFEACSSAEAQLLEERSDVQGEALVAMRDKQEAQVLDTFDRRTCRRIGKALSATAQVQIPTLVLNYQESIRSLRPSLSDDARWRYLRADERARWERLLTSIAVEEHAAAKRRWPVARQIVSVLHRAEVPMLAGTDAPMPEIYPGFSLHDEMALLVKAGLTPREALRSATFLPAKFLGVAATMGSVAVGMRADLVLLDADPTKDIRNTRRIHAVMLDGRLLRRDMLDAVLEEAASIQSPST
jgi:imidazolonepropionase-like amidohydrolase